MTVNDDQRVIVVRNTAKVVTIGVIVAGRAHPTRALNAAGLGTKGAIAVTLAT